MADGRVQKQLGSEAGGSYKRIWFTKSEKCCRNGKSGR